MTDHQRGARPLAQQFHKLAVQGIDLISQFFQRHSILVLRPYGSLLSKPAVQGALGTKVGQTLRRKHRP